MDETNNMGQVPNSNPTPTPTQSAPQPEGGSFAAPIIAGIIILAALVFGALYFMNTEEAAPMVEENQTGELSDSDTEAAIEADLNATNVDNLDAELAE